VEAAWAELRWADRVFSTYLPDSDISRIRRGELRVSDADPAVAEVLQFAEIARRLTAGTFDVRATGALDPSGVVKGWAAARAARALDGLGLDYYLNAGGDVLLRSKRQDAPWRIGIEHPDDPGGLLAVVELPVGGVATSGRAHRGRHIWHPATGRPASGIAQATVIGPALVWADVLATAVVAGGSPEHLDLTGWPPGHELQLVTDDGAVLASPGLRSLLAADVPAPPMDEIG
jgi:thiamine biosynthesis lipoprotein